ncbi:MAG: DNA translocase FtsK 4TM domain-containing protein, partial [Candidatus Pacebacteria bacterium]|nr:DNA translocase FtsK 4TM domain-containing protein [Candidatus Paceibacterota bacterium]
MAKKQKKGQEKESIFEGIKDEVRHGALSLFYFALTIFFILSPFGKAGFVGDKTYGWLTDLLGVGYYILPLLLILLGISCLKESRPHVATTTSAAAIFFFISTLGIVTLVGGRILDIEKAGGFLGNLIEYPMVKLFDVWITFIFLLLFMVVSLFVMFNARPTNESLMFWRKFKKEKKEEEDDDD